MPRAVKFDRYGGVDVLRIVEVDRPVSGPEQVLIRMKAAGINPGEAAIREGAFATQWPATFPSGQGSDLAGVVEAVGSAVRNVAVGDEVIGFTNNRSSHAELVVVEADHLIGRPSHVSWEQAGALFVAGTTAYAAVHAVSLKADDTVVISGAAGGVGSIAVQLAKIVGAKVIGLASAANHTWLADHGVIPIAYGEGVADRIRAASAGKVEAFIDTFGGGYVDMALELGVAPDRIDTIIDFAAAAKHGVKTEGNSAAANAKVLAELASLIDTGRLQIPIAEIYHLVDVREAYQDLARRHIRGKIVLVPMVRLILDGTVVRVRLDRKSTAISLLVVIGVRADGQKVLLAVKHMGGESAEAWRSVLDDLIGRGLRRPEFLIVDGAPGLEKAIAVVWDGALVQRCTVHKHRNLLAHAPERMHEEIGADYTDMIYAATPEDIAMRRKGFIRKWRLKHRAVADSLDEAGDRLFTFANLPPTQWRSARTTNAIERLHEEFKRRIKTQTVLPSAETAAMLFWALLASGQINMRKVDGWQTLATTTIDQPIDLAA